MIVALIVLSLLAVLGVYGLGVALKTLKTVQASHRKVAEQYAPVEAKKSVLEETKRRYRELQQTYSKDRKALSENEGRLARYHLGVGTMDASHYEPAYDTRDVDELADKLAGLRLDIKTKVSNKTACICNYGKDVVVNGRRSEAKKLFNREIRLRLRCLDNEFKAASAVADWNNIGRLIQRVKDAFEDINRSGDIVKTYLQKDYLNLKIKELCLSYELNTLKADLKEEEREEARLIREAEREEERIKAAAEKAETERIMMEKLIAKEMSKLENSTEEQRQLLKLHKKELEILKSREKRAVSMAQLTRAGFVYVISNEASFGAGICKIGMTRRVEPMDRVKELGDASVPELFKVHAFAFSNDAPRLEKYLHNEFSSGRINLVNKRKEFFRVEPQAVLETLGSFDGKIELTKVSDETPIAGDIEEMTALT